MNGSVLTVARGSPAHTKLSADTNTPPALVRRKVPSSCVSCVRVVWRGVCACDLIPLQVGQGERWRVPSRCLAMPRPPHRLDPHKRPNLSGEYSSPRFRGPTTKQKKKGGGGGGGGWIQVTQLSHKHKRNPFCPPRSSLARSMHGTACTHTRARALSHLDLLTRPLTLPPRPKAPGA